MKHDKPYRKADEWNNEQTWNNEQSKIFKENNMETKKKINWLKIWQIVRDLIVLLLTTDTVANKLG